MECKNCSAIIQGHYCHNCGQKTYTERFTVKQIWQDTWESLTNLDKGFIKTIQMMVLKPGVMTEEFLQGKTRFYTKPVQYLLICIGIYIFAISLTGGFESMGLPDAKGMYESMGVEYTKEQMAIQERNIQLMMDYFSLVYLLILPFFSMSTYLLFKKSGYNYAENLIINCYVYGTICFVSLLWLFLVFGIPGLKQYTMFISFASTCLILILLYKKIYRESWVSTMIKSILSFVIGYFVMILFAFLLVIIGVVLFLLLQKIF
jgi:hypothetical protein